MMMMMMTTMMYSRAKHRVVLERQDLQTFVISLLTLNQPMQALSCLLVSLFLRGLNAS